jgi:hypothetical protein
VAKNLAVRARFDAYRTDELVGAERIEGAESWTGTLNGNAALAVLVGGDRFRVRLPSGRTAMVSIARYNRNECVAHLATAGRRLF